MKTPDFQSQLAIAIALAAEAHKEQKDYGGYPFILHPLGVMSRLVAPEQKIVAVLHDILEDCPQVTSETLVKAGISKLLVEAVQALTKTGNESYDDYIARICKFGPLAINVKLADIEENSRQDRGVTIGRARLDKYEKAKIRLLEALSCYYE